MTSLTDLIKNDILYVINPQNTKEELISLLNSHPEIRFVSLAVADLTGNSTDERIPIRAFEDIEEFLNGSVQTDGSSVVLPGIATLNDGNWIWSPIPILYGLLTIIMRILIMRREGL